ncbi:hypothetical protein H2248_005194 [Termitomyces sp. 'cryptogamus']|nr:hypothetical protein H2248_005194 [Termitomyces sp. 'cryptogamus']
MPRGKNGHEQQGKKMAVSPHEESKAKFWGIYRVGGVGIGLGQVKDRRRMRKDYNDLEA